MTRLLTLVGMGAAWLHNQFDRLVGWFKAALVRRVAGVALSIWAATMAWQVIPAALVAVEGSTVILAIGLAEILRLLAPALAPFLAMAGLGVIAWVGMYLAR